MIQAFFVKYSIANLYVIHFLFLYLQVIKSRIKNDLDCTSRHDGG